MIDFINFFRNQVQKWDAENFCGNCWHFGYPQTQEAMNSQQVPEEKKCCVQVMVTDLRWTTAPRYNPVTGMKISEGITTHLTVHFLKPGELGRNNYNETLGHPIEEGKWEQTIKPLVNCIQEDSLAWCEILGFKTQVVQWSTRIRTNWLDSAYDGISIDMSYRSTI